MGQCKNDVTPLLWHWSYVSSALIHLDDNEKIYTYSPYRRLAPSGPAQSPHAPS